MSIETQVEDLIEYKLQDYGLELRHRTGTEATCSTCGKANEQNLDIYGRPNGYRLHQIGACIENLRERIEQIEREVKPDASGKA